MDEKKIDEGNENIMTSAGDEASFIEDFKKKNVILKANLKKKTRLGFFYKRTVTLTNEPKIYHRKENGMVKDIVLNPEYIRLERLDKTKFKILEFSKKKMIYVFRCHD